MINLYIDLDDTLFQTKYKNPKAKIQATLSESGRINSYMSLAQQQWLDIWLEKSDVRLIPVTARSLSQYQRTNLSQDPRIQLAVTYFSGQILKQGQIDRDWQSLWQEKMQDLPVPLAQVHTQMQACIETHRTDPAHFRLFDVDGFYISVKAARDCPLEEREACFSAFRALQPEGYIQHENVRAFSWLPTFLDKKYAVEYLKEIYPADLHLGMGDSHSDWGFMSLCDFQIMPQGSQLQRLLTDVTHSQNFYHNG